MCILTVSPREGRSTGCLQLQYSCELSMKSFFARSFTIKIFVTSHGTIKTVNKTELLYNDTSIIGKVLKLSLTDEGNSKKHAHKHTLINTNLDHTILTAQTHKLKEPDKISIHWNSSGHTNLKSTTSRILEGRSVYTITQFYLTQKRNAVEQQEGKSFFGA